MPETVVLDPDPHILVAKKGSTDHKLTQLLGCVLVSCAVFTIWPALGLRVSEFFHDPSTGFVIVGNPLTEALRSAVWNAAIVIGALAATGMAVGLMGKDLVLPSRAWGFILALMPLGPA